MKDLSCLFPPFPAAHIDVVPAHAASWSVDDPFSGELRRENGTTYVYGRGAIDDKGSLMAIMEALEFRLAMGKGANQTNDVTCLREGLRQGLRQGLRSHF